MKGWLVGILLFCSFFYGAGMLQASNLQGLRRPSLPGESPFWIQISNDAFGFELEGEWDDHLSFGLEGGADFLGNRWTNSLSYAGVTSRDSFPAKPFRYDRLEWNSGWRGWTFSASDSWQFYCIPGGGVLLFGNWGGSAMQSLWHRNLKVNRPIPQDYLRSEKGPVQVNTYLFSELEIGSRRWKRFRFNSALRLNSFGSLMMNTALSFGLARASKTQKLTLAYQLCLLSFREEAFPSFQASNDFSLDLELRLGGLYMTKGIFWGSREMQGTLGFSLGACAEAYLPGKSIREKMEVGSSSLSSPLFRWAWDLSTPERAGNGRLGLSEEKVWLFFAYQSGWQKPWNSRNQEAHRFNAHDWGLEYHWRQKSRPVFDPWVSLFTGFSHVRKLGAGLARAVTRGHRFYWNLGTAAGFRVNFHNSTSPFTYYLGLDASVKMLVGKRVEEASMGRGPWAPRGTVHRRRGPHPLGVDG